MLADRLLKNSYYKDQNCSSHPRQNRQRQKSCHLHKRFVQAFMKNRNLPPVFRPFPTKWLHSFFPTAFEPTRWGGRKTFFSIFPQSQSGRCILQVGNMPQFRRPMLIVCEMAVYCPLQDSNSNLYLKKRHLRKN